MAPASAEQSMSATIANNDEIDLKNVAKALLRRWQWIASCGAFGIVLSTYNMLTTKPIYQGEFQIVLDQSRNLSGAAGLLSDSPALARLQEWVVVAAIQSQPKCKFSTAPLFFALYSMRKR